MISANIDVNDSKSTDERFYVSFEEAKNSGKTFYQLRFQDKTQHPFLFSLLGKDKRPTEIPVGLQKYPFTNELLVKELHVAEELIAIMRNFNDRLRAALEDRVFTMDEHDRRNFTYFNRIGDDHGFCYITNFTRDDWDESVQKEDPSDEDMEEDRGPYGGAFRDRDDYWKYRDSALYGSMKL